MTAELFRMAGDPLGLAFDLMVPCPECDGFGKYPNERGDPRDVDLTCEACDGEGLVPNPVITEPCGTCGGVGGVFRAGAPYGGENYPDCPDCDGRGFRVAASVRVPERVRVVGDLADVLPQEGPWPKVLVRESGFVFLFESWESYEQDITHLWEQPCPECDYRLKPGRWADGLPCAACGGQRATAANNYTNIDGRGAVGVPPSPGEVWEIGRRDCELVPVVADLADAVNLGRWVDVCRSGIYVMEWAVGSDRYNGGPCQSLLNITHHFDTLPEPGQWAGVCGELHLYDKAVRRD